MYKIPVAVPQSALVRFQARALRPGPLQSVKQQISLVSFTDAELQTFEAGPPSADYASLLVADHNQILPYTTLEFQISHNAPVNAPTPYLCPMFTSTGMTAAQVRDWIVLQINDYARVQGQSFPDMRSLHALADPASVIPAILIEMPWGMLDYADTTWDGPGGGEAVVDSLPGVDVPLFPALWGPGQRGIFGIASAYRADYYGDVPVET